MDFLDQISSGEEESPHAQSERHLNTWVALAVAILATFMGVTKVKDDNIVQAMLQAKSDAVDTWAQYQAKSTKEHLSQVTEDQFQVQRALAGAQIPAAKRLLNDRIAFYHKEQLRYEGEKKQLAAKAKGLEESYDAMNFHDDQFDLSDAVLSIALSLLAMTALTRQRWLFRMALIVAAFGLIMGLAGLFGWNFHPTALTRLLS